MYQTKTSKRSNTKLILSLLTNKYEKRIAGMIEYLHRKYWENGNGLTAKIFSSRKFYQRKCRFPNKNEIKETQELHIYILNAAKVLLIQFIETMLAQVKYNFLLFIVC